MSEKTLKLVRKIAPKRILEANEAAIESYDQYKKTADLMERVDLALGKKTSYATGVGSTLHFEINNHAVSSTTTQAI